MSRIATIALLASFLVLDGCIGIQVPKTNLNLTAYDGFRERQLNLPYQLEVEMESVTIWFSDSKLGAETSSLVAEVLGYVITSHDEVSDQALVRIKIKTIIDYVGSLTYVNNVMLTISDLEGKNLFSRTGSGRYTMPGKFDDSMISHKNIFFNSFANAMEPIAYALLNSPELTRIASVPLQSTSKNQDQQAPASADVKSTIDPGAAKPSIYIAYPKGGEELAEESVNVVGYVTSANQTKKFRVFLNRLPLVVDSLWTNAPVDTMGLRGFPVELTLPLQAGENRIQLQILDKGGYLETKNIIVKRIELTETVTSIGGLQQRMPNIEIANREQAVTSKNFMTVLGDWVMDTAKSDYNKGNTMFDQGRFARATYYYHKSVKTDPLGQAWFNLGISEKALGNETEANDAFDTACRMEIPQACDVVD